MKLLKKPLVRLALLCAMLFSLLQVSYAAGMSVSAGQSTVSVGRTVAFTITVPAGSEAWTYSVAYSANLTLESGDLAPMGFEGESRSNQLVFRANDTGTGSVWISAGSYCVSGVDYDASGSASVSIVSASTPDDSEPDYTPSAPGKSGNNALSALTVSAGTLTPAFDPAVTEYTLSLPQGTEKLTLTATPSDSNATIQGDGELTLQEGENTLPLVVTAENGDTKTYTVTAKVAQAPTLFLSFSGAKLGVVKDVEGITPPTGFTAAEPVSQGGDTLPLWVDANGKHTLVYLVDEKGVAGFYLYSRTEGVLSPYLPLAYGGATYIYTGIPSEKAAVPGLKAATVEAFSQTLSGWRYEDAALSDFLVLYLMDDGGQYGYYTYDSKKRHPPALQRCGVYRQRRDPGRAHAVCVHRRRRSGAAADFDARLCLHLRQPRAEAPGPCIGTDGTRRRSRSRGLAGGSTDPGGEPCGGNDACPCGGSGNPGRGTHSRGGS